MKDKLDDVVSATKFWGPTGPRLGIEERAEDTSWMSLGISADALGLM